MSARAPHFRAGSRVTPASPVGAALHILLVVVALALAACGGGEGGAADSPGASATADVPEPTFTEAVEDDDCAVLTPADLAAATGTPQDEIEGRSLGGSGCYYEFADLNINVLGVRVHESVDAARSYFARFTEDATAQEVGEAKQQVREELADEREQGEMSESDEAVAGALVDAMPEEDVGHERWPDIGSGSAMDGRGSVRVRYGNVTVWFTGKTDGEDVLDPGLAQDLARRIVANLDAMK